MGTTYTDIQTTSVPAQPTARALLIRKENIWRLAALALIILLAAGLRFYDLNSLGYVNHYYSAAVKSMLTSWHNFFFISAEPGGSVTVDKPPVGLWVQAASALIFGVNTFGLLLPEILAGIFSVILVYHLVQRSFGAVAGLAGALALAITPVVVATDRNNTMDSILIFTLLLAAWAFIKATETARLRFLLLGAALVGVGFNIKMLEAFLPLPAFYALYFLGTKEKMWRKSGKILLSGVLLLAVSLSWVTIVDLTPASQRPYVGSSSDNSEINLITGYNGIDRLAGMGNSNRTGQIGSTSLGNYLQSIWNTVLNVFKRADSSAATQSNTFANIFGITPQNQSNSNNPRSFTTGPGGFGGAPGGGGGFNTGQAGPFRLVLSPLSNEMSWLLPFGLFTALLLVFRNRPAWPIRPRHQALVLWGGWLLTGAVFFSVASFFHEYYLSMLGAPLAALVGIGAGELWKIGQKRWWLTLLLALPVAIVTVYFQADTATQYTRSASWLPFVWILLGAGIVISLFALIPALKLGRVPAFVCLAGAMFITPGVWSGLTAANSSDNQSLPAAYSGRTSGPANNGALNVNQNLLNYLQANTQGMKYLMAVPSAMQGADYVIATGRPVLYMGGFMGQDKVIDAKGLSELIASGQLRYIFWSQRGNGFGSGSGGSMDVTNWVNNNCKPVSNYNTTTTNSGAPDGFLNGFNPGAVDGRNNGGFNIGGGMNMLVSLYDCGS